MLMKTLLAPLLAALTALTLAEPVPTRAADSPAAAALDGWTHASPREEIAPAFATQPKGGRDGGPRLLIQADGREGLQGWWKKSFSIQGGRHYRFTSFRRAEHLPVPRRNVVARLLLPDAAGKPVPAVQPPAQVGTRVLDAGWKERAPGFRMIARRMGRAGPKSPAPTALRRRRRAPWSTSLQWAPHGRVEWSNVSLAETAQPGRKVRLAAVHFRPKGGKTPMDNCRLFAPLITDAARQKADLVVLPETLTYYGLGKTYAECAEAVPGPSTIYFGELAKQHDLYIVAGLIERDRHLIYNVAVLIAPDGSVAGKYRKVSLPRSEVEADVTPGDDYPVFQTRFGKVGMMVCYDGFFPEVARELSNRGAEVIAWPVWGCNLPSPVPVPTRTTSISSAALTRTSRTTGCSPPFTTTRASPSSKANSGAPSSWRSGPRRASAIAQFGRLQGGDSTAPARVGEPRRRETVNHAMKPKHKLHSWLGILASCNTACAAENRSVAQTSAGVFRPNIVFLLATISATAISPATVRRTSALRCSTGWRRRACASRSFTPTVPSVRPRARRCSPDATSNASVAWSARSAQAMSAVTTTPSGCVPPTIWACPPARRRSARC